jgi:hypothetical protein
MSDADGNLTQESNHCILFMSETAWFVVAVVAHNVPRTGELQCNMIRFISFHNVVYPGYDDDCPP